MLRALLLWLLLGSLGLVAYDTFTARASPRPDKAHVMDGGNGLPTPPPKP